MARLRFMGLAVLLISAGACTTTDANGNPLGLLEAIPSSSALPLQVADKWSGETDEKTATSGDVLFEQGAYLAKSYRVSEATEGMTASPFGVKYMLTPETVLYPAITGPYGLVYCTRDVEAKEMFGTRHRVCLRDSDGDEAMDQVWTTDEVGVTDGHLGIYVVKTEKTIEPAVKLTEIEAPELDRETFAVEYRYTNPLFGSPQLVFDVVRKTGDNAYSSAGIGSDSIKLTDTTQFPRTVLVDSVLIEVLSYEDKTITYRVLEGFAEGDPLFGIRPRVPQTVYVYY